MQEYWVDPAANGRTMLRLGGTWPASGQQAYAGSSRGWAFSPYVSHSWTTVAFTQEHAGIHTGGLESCSAVVYLFGPSDGSPTHAALWHVNCSYYEGKHSPDEALKAIKAAHQGAGDLDLRYAVVGFNGPGKAYQPDHRAQVQEAVRKSARNFANLFRYDIPSEILYFYMSADCGSFGVSAHGYVGTPMAMVVDGIMDKKRLEGFGSQQSGSQQSSGCYLTTAVCNSLGWDDNCGALVRLRWYRDNILARSPGGKEEILEYYQTAPLIVAAIDKMANSRKIYHDIYEGEIVPAVNAIDAGDYEMARDIYRQLVRRLQSAFG